MRLLVPCLLLCACLRQPAPDAGTEVCGPSLARLLAVARDRSMEENDRLDAWHQVFQLSEESHCDVSALRNEFADFVNELLTICSMFDAHAMPRRPAGWADFTKVRTAIDDLAGPGLSSGHALVSRCGDDIARARCNGLWNGPQIKQCLRIAADRVRYP